ncbi:MAG: GntR family transcriptional regulator [Halanaerobiales bacterium]
MAAKEDLNKDVPIPLYFQLYEILKDKIESGELNVGDLLPSERELSEKYDISRPTVRQALKELVNEGFLVREKGKGSFVANPKINYGFIQRLTTYYEDMEKKGCYTKTKILQKKIINPRKVVARKLDIAEDDKIIVLSRVRYIKEEPIVMVMNHIPYKFCPELANEDLENKSLYNVMAKKYDLKSYRAQITMEPTVATEYDIEHLQVEKGAPLHLLSSVTYTRDDKIMDYFESRFRGDKGKVKVEVKNSNTNNYT